MRELTLGADGNATADTGEHIGAALHNGHWYSFLGKGGVQIMADTRDALAFELSTAYAARVTMKDFPDHE